MCALNHCFKWESSRNEAGRRNLCARCVSINSIARWESSKNGACTCTYCEYLRITSTSAASATEKRLKNSRSAFPTSRFPFFARCLPIPSPSLSFRFRYLPHASCLLRRWLPGITLDSRHARPTQMKEQFDVSAKLLIGCKTNRSAEACRLLVDAGFTEIYNVESQIFMRTRAPQVWE